MKPPSLLKLFLFRCISIASFTRQSTYPDVLSLLRCQWTDAMTHTDAMFCHCWFLELMQTYLSMVLFAPHLDSPSPQSYIHFPQSHGIWHTPRALSSNWYLADLSHLCDFLFLVCELFWYYVSPEVYWLVWRNGIMAVPVGFLFCNYSSRFCCWAHLILLRLYLFCPKTCLRYIAF
jgi:hypothetical protein